MATARESARLRTLLETGLAISSELSLDAVLQRIVEAAVALTGALPEGRLVVIPDAGHIPMLETPDAVVRELCAFTRAVLQPSVPRSRRRRRASTGTKEGGEGTA